MKSLETFIIDVLEREITYNCIVKRDGEEIILEISDNDFERNMGYLARQIQSVIERNLPERQEDLFITVRNINKGLNNRIKIWKNIDD